MADNEELLDKSAQELFKQFGCIDKTGIKAVTAKPKQAAMIGSGIKLELE